MEQRRYEDKSNMTKVILAIGLLCILLGAGMSFVINVKPDEGDLLSDFQQQQADNIIPENPRFKNLQEQRLRDKIYAFINQDDQEMNLTEMLAELETTKKVMRNTLSSQKKFMEKLVRIQTRILKNNI